MPPKKKKGRVKMVVMILERAPTSLRGELTRWMVEPHTGVFVAELSAMVRDKLWERVCDKAKGGACILIYSSDKEQGYVMRMWGQAARTIVDFDGLSLIQVP